MRKHIIALSVFISSSAFLLAQPKETTAKPEPLFVSPTNSELSAKARILARHKLSENCIENHPDMMEYIEERAIEKGEKAFDKIAVYDYYSEFIENLYFYEDEEITYYYLTNEDESEDAYWEAYDKEYDRLCEKYDLINCRKEGIDNTDEDLDKAIDILKKRNIDPGHISYFYSNQVIITNDKEIERILKNTITNKNRSKPLKKYTKNNVSRIFLVVYQWEKGSHVKAFLFTPEGIIFERLYFTNVTNVKNPRTGTTIYVTEEEALILTRG